MLVISILNTPQIAYGDFASLEHFDIEFIQLFKGGQDSMLTDLPGHAPRQRLNLNFNTRFIDTFFWENTFHSLTDSYMGSSQFRTVGWQFKFGVDIFNPVDVFYYHHSQHYLDHESGYGWPKEDGIGIRLKLK